MNNPEDPRFSSGNLQFKLGEKKTLYTQLSELYFLPPRDSTGVTKDYLDKVKQGKIFRVELKVINRFLVELKPSQLKRSLYTCKFEAYFKVDKLLTERGDLQLGFEEGKVPDGTWLYKVARFVDRSNVCGLFMASLEDVIGNSDSETLYKAQRQAEKALVGDTGLGKRSEIKTCISDLVQSQKRSISRQAELTNLTIYIRQLNEQVEKDKQTVERQLANTALVVYQAGRGMTTEEALQARDEEKKRVHETLRLVYATDCVMNREKWVGQLAGEFLKPPT